MPHKQWHSREEDWRICRRENSAMQGTQKHQVQHVSSLVGQKTTHLHTSGLGAPAPTAFPHSDHRKRGLYMNERREHGAGSGSLPRWPKLQKQHVEKDLVNIYWSAKKACLVIGEWAGRQFCKQVLENQPSVAVHVWYQKREVKARGCKSHLGYRVWSGLAQATWHIILTPYKSYRQWDAAWLVLSFIRFSSELQCYVWCHSSPSSSPFLHINVSHHFNNNKMLEEQVIDMRSHLLHGYLILVENILLFTPSQELLTVGDS